MKKILISGAGRIGSAIAILLKESGQYDVTLADKNARSLDAAAQDAGVSARTLDVSDKASLAAALSGQDIVLSAASFDVNVTVAQAALEAGCSYFDLTEDVATTNAIKDLAEKASDGQVFMPQCGLAPGFIGILGHHLASQFDSVEDIKMRVGALPQHPNNRMLYNLTWSTEGLINEYCNPCDAVVYGHKTKVRPLEGLEEFSLDGVLYEAFNTSGGLGTLCETWQGKVQNLDYKTVRYRGHRELMSFLLQDLQLGKPSKRELLKEIFESAVPVTRQDVVLVMVTVKGYRDGVLEQISSARKIYKTVLYGREFSAIQLTTAASVCAVIDLFNEKLLPQKGFVSQEQINFDSYINNRFGRMYVDKAKQL